MKLIIVTSIFAIAAIGLACLTTKELARSAEPPDFTPSHCSNCGCHDGLDPGLSLVLYDQERNQVPVPLQMRDDLHSRQRLLLAATRRWCRERELQPTLLQRHELFCRMW